MPNDKQANHAAAQLAGDVMQQLSEQVKVISTRNTARRHGNRSRKLVILAAVLLAVTVMIINIFGDQEVTLSGAESRYYIANEMSTLVYDLNDYREKEGAYPEKLVAVGMPYDPAWSYRRTGTDHFWISLRENNQKLTY